MPTTSSSLTTSSSRLAVSSTSGATSLTTRTRNSSYQQHHNKRLHEEKGNQQYRLQSWNTSQYNLNSQLPSLVQIHQPKQPVPGVNATATGSTSKFSSSHNLAARFLSGSRLNVGSSVHGLNKKSSGSTLTITNTGKASNDQQKERKYFKIVVIGDSQIGKTSLIQQAKIQAQNTGKLFPSTTPSQAKPPDPPPAKSTKLTTREKSQSSYSASSSIGTEVTALDRSSTTNSDVTDPESSPKPKNPTKKSNSTVSSHASTDEGIGSDEQDDSTNSCINDTVKMTEDLPHTNAAVQPTYSNGMVDRYRFHIPILNRQPAKMFDSTFKADATGDAGIVGQDASQYKWIPAEIVDLLLGDSGGIKKPSLYSATDRNKAKTTKRKQVTRKLSKKFSMVKRNKTFKTPMSKYALDADAFILMFSLTDERSLDSVTSRWLFEINRLLTIKRPIKVLVASHLDLRQRDIAPTGQTKLLNFKWFVRKPQTGSTALDEPDDVDDDTAELLRTKDGFRQAREISAVDYIETSTLNGENCLKVFQRVIEEIQYKNAHPFSHSTRTPSQYASNQSSFSNFLTAANSRRKKVFQTGSLPTYLRSKTNSTTKTSFDYAKYNQSSSRTSTVKSATSKHLDKRKNIKQHKREIERRKREKYKQSGKNQRRRERASRMRRSRHRQRGGLLGLFQALGLGQGCRDGAVCRALVDSD